MRSWRSWSARSVSSAGRSRSEHLDPLARLGPLEHLVTPAQTECQEQQEPLATPGPRAIPALRDLKDLTAKSSRSRARQAPKAPEVARAKLVWGAAALLAPVAAAAGPASQAAGANPAGRAHEDRRGVASLGPGDLLVVLGRALQGHQASLGRRARLDQQGQQGQQAQQAQQALLEPLGLLVLLVLLARLELLGHLGLRALLHLPSHAVPLRSLPHRPLSLQDVSLRTGTAARPPLARPCLWDSVVLRCRKLVRRHVGLSLSVVFLRPRMSTSTFTATSITASRSRFVSTGKWEANKIMR
mmetsp:Transcript_23042/g.53867  ORF Transcript_23042/g.53867 Transcript_23042/m.53867 type:complete len:300 (-) Transcript_23042:210-1109(-)